MSVHTSTSQHQCPQTAIGDFKQHLYHQLKAAGVMSSLKTQLRSQVLTKLQKQECSVHAAVPSSEALWRNIMNSLIVDYLSACHYHYTLSVFQPEAGISGLQALTHADILQFMQVSPGSPLQTALGTKYTLSTADGVVSEPAFAISLLQSVTEVLGTKSEERERPYKSMEQRMAAYRQECETRLQEEVGQVRQVEVKAARAEGVNNAHHVASQERASLQQDQQERLQQLQAQEQQMLERMEKQQHDMHSSLLEQRQQLQAQEEDLATWKADAQRQLDIQQGRLSGREQRVASHEQMLTRQDAESACQVAEAQAAAASAYRNARRDLDQEYKAHREALDRERRTLEADRERVQKLEAEVVSLRGNNKRLKAAEVSWAEAEARAAAHAGVEEALRYQLSQLQNAVKGPGGGLGEGGIAAVYPPGQRAQGQGLDPAFLAVQLRKLQKKQKGVLRELQATAGREAFWKHSAHSAEQALDEAVEGREAALQQVEEARLALRAADRDNAELQARLQQASMSISSRHSQHAAPTARQLWAVPRERTGAIGSTAVSPVSRLGDIGKQEKKMRAELAQFKRQLQAQRDASALELQRLQHPSPSLGGSTSVPASALSVSTASSLSGYSTDVENGAMLTGPSPLPFVSPSHGLGPQMHPRLTPTSHTTSPRYTAYTSGSPYQNLTQHMPAYQHGPPALQQGHDMHSRHSMQPPVAEQRVSKPAAESQHDRRLETVGPGQSADNAQGQQATDAARQGSVADPLSVLQINLSAMEEAITLTDAAAVPPSQAGVSEASRQPEKERPADVLPKQVASAPATAAMAPKLTQPSSVQPEEHKQPEELSVPISALVPQQIVTMLPNTEAPALSEQAPSMPAVILAPKAPQPSVSMLAGNLAPVGPPAVRTTVSQASGSLPQLAASVVQPPAPVPIPSPIPSAATAAVSPPAGSVSHQAVVSSSADANISAKVPVNTAASRAGAVQSSTVTGQAAGVGGGEQVNVSAASAVTLDEARAAGTARQAALAVLDDSPLPTQGVLQSNSSNSLPDRPFGTAQSNSISAGHQLDPLPGLGLSHAVRAQPQEVSLAASSFGRPTQSLMAMTGPLPASGAERDPESPLGGRPSQSETAVTNGKGVATMTEPQDLHAAHLVHVLQAHKAAQQLTDSAAVSSKLQPQRQVMDSLLAMDPAVQGDGSGIAAGSNRSLQQQGAFTGPGMLSQQHSKSEASEDAESVASQLQLLRSGELQAQASVPDLNELEGGSMMALPKEPSRHFVASGSDDDGFPAIDYNDVYKIKDTLAQDGFPEDLPEAEVASLGSISIADAEVELADFDAASGDSVF
ncbi:MAG: oral-facial-digital syndrome 1 [Trebouxia sp. A1-2]|nr:MAG: oral-facial-digital syndrome 1 [Trebouxia sp. A1-2]